MNVFEEFETRMSPGSVPGFRRLVGRARARDPILLGERAMVRMMTSVQWMLDRVGVDGIRLTKAGHLPPAVVVRAVAELDWGWPVEVNRESHCLPLWELRLHLREAGLLRVSKGVLLRTKKGAMLADDPRGLWWHVARTIHKDRSQVVSDATRILLLFIATRSLTETDDYMVAVSQALGTLGWTEGDNSPPTPGSVWRLVAAKWRILNHLHVFEPRGLMEPETSVSAAGAAFARAALQADAEATQ